MRRRTKALIALAAAVAAGAFVPPPSSGHFYDGCRKDRCKAHVIEPYQPKLRSIHRCEARDVGWYYDGLHDGGLQFAPRTWWSVGGTGYAHQHHPREQKYRAVILYHRIDCWRCTAGWPNCG